ncbi:hypothetical protein CHH28_01300 [Bacterioplanes sanyensis]|uniref:GIY-YIG domain-containing protein n=1 Tax=Bacterioplanes sanyensis TaxID=1249553 RepID=A0A222FF71_9GAMM|nr:GIY-YIG nuclease family protein [Bacterioplanes sanyensis]ASP37399.1 hypothetical protein CHH28_01300 [Bacterioplanes sanyensis]
MCSNWSVYLIRTAQGALYCGITTDVERRFQEHQQGGRKAAKALRGRTPLQLVFTHAGISRLQALQLEYRIKQLSKSQKEALVTGSLRAAQLLPGDKCSG